MLLRGNLHDLVNGGYIFGDGDGFGHGHYGHYGNGNGYGLGHGYGFGGYGYYASIEGHKDAEYVIER